jgi:acyl dehydratase
MPYFFDTVPLDVELRTAVSEPFTQQMVDAYVRLTGDSFPAHVDHEFARRLGFPSAMVPGNFVVDRSTGLVYQSGHLSSLLLQAAKKTRFVHPLFIGERIYAIDRVLEKQDRPAKPYGRVVIERRVFNGDDRLLIVLEQDDRMLKERGAIDYHSGTHVSQGA